ncbi:peptidoglycan-binding domain-containing protein [Portibacter lacus]|uniref:peptidoglycan-binding domain-containing protein n=1 Tax=Portibacter lacus TaxID=1099794 RepID=UPI001F429FF5|nr:peptidoglycan-binding domain-containing protein [Portibacter lacus]
MKSQDNDRPPYTPGKCHAKCLFTSLQEEYEIAYPVYVGNDENILQNFVTDTTIVIKEADQKWVTKGRDVNCLSSNPEDCMVWCLVEIKAEEIYVEGYLKNTKATDEFILEYYYFDELNKKGAYIEWREVVCADKVTSRLLKEVRTALGIKLTSFSHIMDKKTKAKLIEYQRENGLPIGHLDLETLAHLGIEL